MFNTLIIEQEEKLRKYCSPVITFNEQYLTQIYNLLLSTLRRYNIGYAISAPQMGVYERIILIDKVNPYIAEGRLTEAATKNILMINPIIVKEGKDTSILKESCLSFPKEERGIIRPTKIVVQYQDIQGKPKKARLAGIEARCVYHEIDHLNGKLIIDYESI